MVNEEQARSELRKAEIDFRSQVHSNGFLKSMDDFLDSEVRVYRQNVQPIVGIDSTRTYFSKNPYFSSWEPINDDAATSGDLGYTYGSYVVRQMSGNPGEDEMGYYLHGWKRDALNRWRIVAEITSPLPTERPKAKQ